MQPSIRQRHYGSAAQSALVKKWRALLYPALFNSLRGGFRATCINVQAVYPATPGPVVKAETGTASPLLLAKLFP